MINLIGYDEVDRLGYHFIISHLNDILNIIHVSIHVDIMFLFTPHGKEFPFSMISEILSTVASMWIVCVR